MTTTGCPPCVPHFSHLFHQKTSRLPSSPFRRQQVRWLAWLYVGISRGSTALVAPPRHLAWVEKNGAVIRPNGRYRIQPKTSRFLSGLFRGDNMHGKLSPCMDRSWMVIGYRCFTVHIQTNLEKLKKSIALPETNIAPENRPSPKEMSFCNHPFSGANC